MCVLKLYSNGGVEPKWLMFQHMAMELSKLKFIVSGQGKVDDLY